MKNYLRNRLKSEIKDIFYKNFFSLLLSTSQNHFPTQTQSLLKMNYLQSFLKIYIESRIPTKKDILAVLKTKLPKKIFL